MRLCIVVLISVLLLSSCGYEIYSLKSECPKSYEFHSDKQSDELWDNMLTYFGAKSIHCSVIDKPNGIIETKKLEFKHSFTFEKNDGSLDNPKSYIILTRIRPRAKGYTIDRPFRLLLKLRITISTVISGSNIKMELLPVYINYGGFTVRPEYPDDMKKDYYSIYRSTGIFEEEIFNQVK